MERLQNCICKNEYGSTLTDELPGLVASLISVFDNSKECWSSTIIVFLETLDVYGHIFQYDNMAKYDKRNT